MFLLSNFKSVILHVLFYCVYGFYFNYIGFVPETNHKFVTFCYTGHNKLEATMAEELTLRAKDHSTTLLTSLAGLRDCKALVDVTMTCEGEIISAHKTVLAACSSYFKQLFEVRCLLVCFFLMCSEL